MSNDILRVERDGAVATLTLVRPAARNALNMELKRALAVAIREVARDNSVRCVVVTGTSDSFCAGGDIVEMELNDTPVHSRSRLDLLLHDVFIPLHEMEKPTIAAVNGFAFGAGLSLALACDLIVATRSAKFSCAFTRMGLLPDCGSLYFLPRRIPVGKAKELFVTGRQFDAEEAASMGIVTTLVDDGDLDSTVRQWAKELAAGPTVALGLTKRLLDRSLNTSLEEMATLESFAQAVLFATDDHQAARKAFQDKSKPTFEGH